MLQHAGDGQVFSVFPSFYFLHLFQPLPGLQHFQLLRRTANGHADEGTELVVALLPKEELTVVDHSDDLSIWKWKDQKRLK